MNKHMPGVRFVWLLVCVLATACATSGVIPGGTSNALLARGDDAFKSLLRMPAVELAATPDGYRSWQADEIFQAGNDAYDEAEWRTAIAYYDRLIREFPDSGLTPAAMFNAGLAAQHVSDMDRAEVYFEALVERHVSHDLTPSALWNLIELRELKEAWREVLQTVERLKNYDLDENDAFELDARAGIARTILKPNDANVDRLEQLAMEYDRRIREGGSLGRATLARTHWTIGEVFLGRSQAVIVDPESRGLEAELETKAQHLLRAQDAYMRTVRALDPGWATAAVYRIGFAYESFYADLVSAPAPKELDSEESTIYFEEVRNALGPVKRKAEMAYQRIIRFSKQYGVETDWIRRAEDRLSRLQRLKLPEAGSTQG